MSFVQRDAAIRVVFNAIEKTTAVQNVIKRRRNKAGLVFIAEAAKGVVLYSDFVVDADIKIVAALAPPGIGKKIVSRDVGIRLWKQRCQTGCQWIDQSARENIRRIAGAVITANWNST